MLISLSLRSLDLDLELAGRHARHLGSHHGVDPQVGQGAPHQAAGEGHELGAGLQVLSVLAGLGQELEAVVLQHVDPLVVGPQVIYLLPDKTNIKHNADKCQDLSPEHCHPEVLADELEEVELVLELGIVLGEPLNESVAGVEAQQL